MHTTMTLRLLALVLASVALAVVATSTAGVAGASPAVGEPQINLEGPIADGVYLRERVDPGPVTSVTVEIEPDSPTAFVPVLSGNRVDGGTERVSSMCHRVGGVLCVNANFAICPTCGQPFGGVVQDGVLLRSPTPFAQQVSVINGRFTLDPWMWSAGLWSSDGGASLDMHGVNTGLSPGGLYLYTRAYGDSTGTPPGTFELVLRAPEPLWTGIGMRQPVELLALNNTGDTTIPEGGAVVAAYGSTVPELRQFVDAHKQSRIELVTNTPGGLEESFAGHPVILRNGQVAPMDPADGMVTNRHPRTLVGWNDAGKVWVVAVDGRRARSRGMTLPEAAEYLRSMGASDAVNLDGGGSTAMVTTCPSPSGWCLRNRPSDGFERNVWVALALVPRAPASPPPAPAQKKPAQKKPVSKKPAQKKPAQKKPAQKKQVTTTTSTVLQGRSTDAEGGPDQRGEAKTDAEASAPASTPTADDPLWTAAPAPDPAAHDAGERSGAQSLRASSSTTMAGPDELDDVAAGVPAAARGRDLRGVVAAAVALVGVEAAGLGLLARRRRLSRGRADLPSTTGSGRGARRWGRRRRPTRRGTGAG